MQYARAHGEVVITVLSSAPVNLLLLLGFGQLPQIVAASAAAATLRKEESGFISWNFHLYRLDNVGTVVEKKISRFSWKGGTARYIRYAYAVVLIVY